MDNNLIALLWWVIGTILLCYLTAIFASHMTNKSWAKAAEHGWYHAFNRRIYKVMVVLESMDLRKAGEIDEGSDNNSINPDDIGGDDRKTGT